MVKEDPNLQNWILLKEEKPKPWIEQILNSITEEHFPKISESLSERFILRSGKMNENCQHQV